MFIPMIPPRDADNTKTIFLIKVENEYVSFRNRLITNEISMIIKAAIKASKKPFFFALSPHINPSIKNDIIPIINVEIFKVLLSMMIISLLIKNA